MRRPFESAGGESQVVGQSRRDALLMGVAEAAKRLLSIADFDAAVHGALEAIATAAGIDRIYILENQIDPSNGEVVAHCLFERTVPGIVKSSDTPGRYPMSYTEFGDWPNQFRAGQAVQAIARELSDSAQDLQAQDEALSLLAVPIMVEGDWWGVIGFDDCTTERVWSEAEIAVLETAAACMGGAIERDRTHKEREAAAQAQAEELSRVNSVLKDSLRRLASEPDLDVFLGHVINSINQVVGAAKGHVFIHDAEVNTLKLQLSVQQGTIHLGAIEDDPRLFHTAFPADITPAYPEMCKTNEVILLSLIQEASDIWPGTAEWHHRCGHQEAAVVTLRSGDRPIGMLGLCFTEPVTITEEAKALINALADQAAVAIDLARLAEENQQNAIAREREAAAQARAAELAKANEAISKTLNTLAAKPQLSEFLGQLLLAIAQQVNSRLVHLFLYDEATHSLNLHTNITDGQVFAGPSPNDFEFFHHPIPADITPAWQLISEAEDIVISDLSSPLPDEIWWPGTQAWHQAQGHVSMACIPMKAGDQALGFIGFAFRDRTVLSNEQLEFMQALTNQAIVAIQLTRLAEEAKQTAILQEQERAAQERAAELEKANIAINQSLTALTKVLDLDEFLGQILRKMADQVEACKAHLFLYDEVTDTLCQYMAVQDGIVHKGFAPTDPAVFHGPWQSQRFWQAVINSPKPLTLDERHPEVANVYLPESLPWHQEQGHVSSVCPCLRVGDKPIGFIGFAFRHLPILSDEQLEFIQALTNQTTLAIQLTRLAEEAKQTAILQEQERAAQERAAQLTRSNQALKSSLDSLAQQPELDAFLQRVVNEAAAQTGADSGHLFLSDEAANATWLHCSTDNSGDWQALPDMAIWLKPIPLDLAPDFWELIYKKKPVIVENLKETLVPGPHIWEPSIAWHLQRNHTSFICAPLVLGDRVLGFLGLPFVNTTTINPEDVELTQALTNQATLAIQLTRLAEQARTSALTDERNRLAREIHDTLAQAFTGVSLQLEAVRSLLTDPAALRLHSGLDPNEDRGLSVAEAHILRARDLARAGLSEARRSVRALRSEALETDDLPNALRKALAQTQRDTELTTQFYLEGQPIPLPDDIQLNLLRIAQEAITNALRHADATQLDLTLSFSPESNDPKVQLRIVDNGRGFDTSTLLDSSGFGIIGIRERTARFYGSFDLQSTPNIGTTLEINIPLREPLR